MTLQKHFHQIGSLAYAACFFDCSSFIYTWYFHFAYNISFQQLKCTVK